MPISREQRPFDIIVLGATGFTGRYVAKFLDDISKEQPALRWAIAGRSEEKLKSLQEELGKTVDMFVANVSDDESLDQLCGQTRLVLSCVGPYHKCGEPVVRAAVNNGCDYLDITGEPIFMERMALLYHDAAKEKESLIVSACGFDSIPAEMGVQLTAAEAQKQGFRLKHIDSFITTKGNSSAHITTLESALNGFSRQKELRAIRSKLRKSRWTSRVPTLGRKNIRTLPFKDERIGKWSILFPGPDASVVRNSQRYLTELGHSGPFPNYSAYLSFPTLAHASAFILAGTAMMGLGRTKLGSKLVLKFPEAFSAGMVSSNGPSEKEIEDAGFTTHFYGTGEGGEHIKTRVCGPDPGYAATPRMLVVIALFLLNQREKVEVKGGVYTPGAVLPFQELRSQLATQDVQFEHIS